MNIKNKPPLTLVVNRNEVLLGITDDPDIDDEREDVVLGLLVESRKDQNEIEVNINVL